MRYQLSFIDIFNKLPEHGVVYTTHHDDSSLDCLMPSNNNIIQKILDIQSPNKSVRDLEKFIANRKHKQYHFVIDANCQVSRISSLLKDAVMEESPRDGNVLITVKDEESQEKTNISLPYLYDISSEVIESIKSVEGVFEIEAN